MSGTTRVPAWREIAEAGGIDAWIHQELQRQGLVDEVTDPSSLKDAEKQAWKSRREEERRVRGELAKVVRAAYKKAHLVHLGPGVYFSDDADVDRFDLADPDARRRQNELPELKNGLALAAALGLEPSRLRWLAFHREVDSGTHYRRWTIPKRDGSPRLISAPKAELRRVQTWIRTQITEKLPIHGAAYGFVPGRSIKTHARIHGASEVVIKLDLRDFYPSIALHRVKGLFRKAGYGEQVATVLALLVTESPREPQQINGKTYYVATGPRSLPQGAPTSPSITNTICLRLDARLSALAEKLGFRYSRYADDLCFSHPDTKEPPSPARLVSAVRRIVVAEGFVLHPDKTRVMRKGRRQKITGLVINQAPPGAPLARVPRDVVRNLRAALKNRELGRPGKGESLASLKGLAAHVYMTDPTRGAQLLQRIAALEARSVSSEQEST